MNRVIKRPPSASASPFPSGLIKNIIIITAILSSSYDDVINVINGNDYDNNSNDNNNQSRSHLLCSGFQIQRIQRFRSPLRADVGVGAGVGSGVHRYTHSHEINHNYHTSRSNRSHDSQRASSNHHALFMSGSDRDDDIQVPPLSLAFNSDLYGSSSSSSKTSTNADTKKEISSSLDQALIEARELKERAARERLEAEKMSVQLTLDKIALLEKELEKIAGDSSSSSSSNGQSNGQSNSEMGATTGEVGEVQVQVPSSKDVVNIAEKEFDPKMLKRSQDLQSQIQDLKKLLNVSNGSSSSTDSSSTTASTNNIDMKIEESMQNIIVEEETTTSTSTSSSEMKKDDDMDMDIPPMPKDVYQKRMDAFKRFPSEIKGIYASAVGADENDTLETIVEKVYLQEQIEKMKKKENKSDDSDDSTSLLDIANAQAGYSMLPPPIQAMISEAVGLSNEKNTTKIIEKLIDTNKVRPTGEFGGVEFAMGDIEEENEEEEKKKRGKEREFTKEEMKSAIDLFENLPLPMKTMLANGLEDGDGAGGSIDSSNSTAIIEAMIREKKILPSDEGVEFVVFGNGDDSDMDIFGEAMESFEGDNYVRSMLPAVMRKEGNMPSEKDADAFFGEVLGSRTFNPISKPERVPGGYVIRGENRLKTSDELVVALEKALEKSSVADKLRLYYIRDPTLVTEEQFETNTFELPVVFITGPDISPETNRLVKPLITVLGGFCVATFSLAVCFSNEDAVQDPLWLEQMASPLIMSILFTQLAHEAAHQVVAFKDKFKTGAPTIVPSIQLGLTGCITPLKTPPPNFNSLFDFAISGPLVGMFLSLVLMYTGLEQQVFMDTLTQSQLPSLPVELVRSSSLAGGLVEWLLGDGVLLSPDPSASIRLHPLAIAGFVGLLANALSLLPIGNTDGGRVALSLFGRSISRVVRTGTIGLIVISSFFGGDNMNILLFYTIYAQIWQRESEIPSKNEIENVDDIRAITAFVTGLLVALTVIPMF